jgi:hypothetical protein
MDDAIETNRLRLRPFRSDDVPFAFDWFGDPVVLGKSAHLENERLPRSFFFFAAALIGSPAAPGPQVNVVLTFWVAASQTPRELSNSFARSEIQIYENHRRHRLLPKWAILSR